jgi:hypothetical protein
MESSAKPPAAAATSIAPANAKELTESDIRTGMNVAQTVYAVVMTLGLKISFEALYPVIFRPQSSGPGALSPYLVGFAFLTIMLLAMRFFWVLRNLYAYALHSLKTKSEKDVFRPLMLYHFPIALLHAVLFFFICEAFVEMTLRAQSANSPVVHFVAIYAALLLLNALWLFAITPSDRPGPARTVWARSNLAHAALAFAVLAAFGLCDFSVVALLIAACAIFTFNSVIDLHQAAEYYILFDR